MKKLSIILSVLLVCTLVLVGCSGGEETTSQKDTKPSVSEPQYGGTLRVIVGGEASSLYPVEKLGPEDYTPLSPCVEGLFRMDVEGQIVPFLAESYKEDPDANTVTIYLREGVRFQDDTIFDAEAAAWNMEQYRVGPYTAGNWGSVSSVEVVDDYTVRINLTEWDSRLLDTLSYVWVVSPTAFEKNGVEWMRNNPVGTGPFKLVSWQRDTTKVYEKWDGYWQKGKPYLDKIEINIIADPMVQVASFLAGENDILTLLNPTDARTIQNDYPNLVLVTSPVVGFTRSLMFDSANPDSPFSDLLVRQAVSYAIDREAIIDGVYKGFGKLTHQTKSPDMWSYNPNVKGHPYDPDKARELLEEAGYGQGFSTTLYYKSDQIYQDLFIAVQADLAAIHINVELQPLNPATYGEMYFAGNWFGGIFGADMQSIPEPLGLRGFFSSVKSMPSFKQCIIHPQKIDDIIGKITASTDFEAKKALGQELERLICDEYCICPNLGYWPTMIAKYPYVHDDYCGWPRTEPYTFADAWIEE